MSNKIGIILGSGLNKFTEELIDSKLIYEDLNSFHKLKILSGKIETEEIILFSGRRHFYEGYGREKILENVEMAKEFGIKFLIITNAAGGLNSTFRVSDLMLITSHLNFIQTKFPCLRNQILYDRAILDSVKKLSIKEKIVLRSGNYCCSSGPMYETKSEIRFLERFGIDAVGMSTIPEIIYANKSGIKTLAFSCITNLLTESSTDITNHDEVIEAGNKAYINFSKLIKSVISNSADIFH